MRFSFCKMSFKNFPFYLEGECDVDMSSWIAHRPTVIWEIKKVILISVTLSVWVGGETRVMHHHHHHKNSVGLYWCVFNSALMFSQIFQSTCRSLNNALFSWLQFKALTDSWIFASSLLSSFYKPILFYWAFNDSPHKPPVTHFLQPVFVCPRLVI